MTPDEVLGWFGARVRGERQRRGISQEDLAAEAGLDRTYVSGIERGERNLGLKNAARLAQALRVALADLLPGSASRATSVARAIAPFSYRRNDDFTVACGFDVDASAVELALHATNSVLAALPMTLFTTIDLKSQSGIVGAVFAAELARGVGAVPNPIEKGHPDIVPVTALTAAEAQLRNYPSGLEIKSTLGGVTQGSALRAGEARIRHLENITWQAHHRDVRSLMGLVWDFPSGQKSAPAHPAITGVFFSNTLIADDWGAISGTTGRNTKVTGMLKSGHRKMASGAIVVIDDEPYVRRYSKCLGATFGQLGPIIDS